MKTCRMLAVVCLSLSMLLPAVCKAQEVLLTDDAQVNSAATTTNYGASTTLVVNSTNSVLLQFDLADVLPAGITASQVTRARLILFPDSITTAGNFNVYGITGTWAEGSLTYANRPSVSTSVAGSGAVKLVYRSAFVAVTGLVQNWITDPSTNHGFEVKASGSTSFSIDSKENTATSTPAILQIDLIGPAGATGPQGPKGATGATGPQGPAGTVTLPFSGSAATSDYAFEVGSSGSGSGLFAYGGTAASSNNTLGGYGLVAEGGSSAGNPGAESGSSGGLGIEVIGGDGYNDGTTDEPGGAGAYLIGGSNGGYGAVAYGSSGGPFGGGVGLEVYPGAENGEAAEFFGSVYVGGTLSKAGGSFKIDHPLDPANKYLSHSFVESPDMMNIYNGNVVTDGSGSALVKLPDYFEALNTDYRYQLTVIGQFAQAIVASKIANGAFMIRTDKPGVEVSWQVTGVRQDAWANAHRIPVEQEKPDAEKGHYLHPELYGHAGEPNVLEVRGPQIKPLKAAGH